MEILDSSLVPGMRDTDIPCKGMGCNSREIAGLGWQCKDCLEKDDGDESSMMI